MDPDAVRTVDRAPHGSTTDPSLIDFSANTNPRTPPGARAAYDAAFDRARHYPPEPPDAFRETAADYVACDPADVVATPGGAAALRLTFSVTVTPSDSVLIPAPSFSEYAREAALHGASPTFANHDTILEADPSPHALAVVCNPNNPTGNAYDPTALRTFAERCHRTDTVLLVDEAFLDFTPQPSLAGTPGVVVARSLTKMFGLPGIRAGFAAAMGDLRDALAAARHPWNVGTPALALGSHCLDQTDFVTETRRRVAAERERLRDGLNERFGVHPSDAPFLLLDAGDRDVDAILETARDHGIALRDARTFRGLDSHLRVAVRVPDDNDRLLEVLTSV